MNLEFKYFQNWERAFLYVVSILEIEMSVNRIEQTSSFIIALLLIASVTVVTFPSALPSAYAVAPVKSLSLVVPASTTTSVTSGDFTVTRLLDGSPDTSGTTHVTLGSSSITGIFRDSADTTTITQVTISNGQSSATFKYQDSTAGTFTISVSATG